MRWLATICYPVLAVFLFPAHAFGDSPFKISGIVLEYGSDRPIAGAQAKLYGDEDVLTTTNAEGKFEFQLESAGTYTVAFSKAGYRVIGANGSGSMMSATLMLDDAHPAGTVRMRMALPATLSGTVLDDVTRKPVAGLQVSIMREMQAGWNRVSLPTMPVTTDPQGHFIQKTLPPGRYAVRIDLMHDRLLQSFTEKDRDLIEDDYDQATFPGGGGADGASTVDLASGGTIDLGNLMAKKTSYYGVEVAFPPSICDSAATAQVERIDHLGALSFTGDLGNVPCGKDFLIRSLKAGEYTIQAWMKRSDGSVRYASASVTIRDHAPKVTLALAPNVDLYGRISVEKDTAPIALEQIRIQLQSYAMRVHFDRETWPDENGNFRVPDIQPTNAVMQVVGLTKPFYIKSIRYNGAPLDRTFPSISFTLDANAATHRLEILIDDKPAALFGKVMKGDQAVEHPYVVLLHWPRFGQPVAVSGDANGEFQFAGLTPGEYRVLAVSENDQENIHDPDVLARVLAKAQKVELGPSGVQRVTLELVK